MDAIQRSGLTWAEESELRWYFARDYESAMGLRSSLGGQIEQLKLGRGMGEGGHHASELSDRAFSEAGRLNRVTARINQVPPDLRAVLAAAFGPQPPTGLEVWGELAPLVPLTSGATDAHRRARAERPLLEWLQRLSLRVRRRAGHLLIRDAQLVAELRIEAEELLAIAAERYRAARPRRSA